MGVAVLLLAAVAWAVSAMSGDDDAPLGNVVAPRHVVPGDTGAVPFEGSVQPRDGAPVVEVHADFLCSHCAQFDASTGDRLRAKANAGEIDLRFVPMTIMDGTARRGPAHDVMGAAVCALDQQGPGAFWRLHDAFFDAGYAVKGEQPSREQLVRKADDAGVTGLGACIDESRFVPWLDSPREAARDRGVTGTPTVFVDGKKVADPTTEAIESAIGAA